MWPPLHEMSIWGILIKVRRSIQISNLEFHQMGTADVVAIADAAEIFGVPTETLMKRLDRGGLPEAVNHSGSWCVPSASLTQIADREGWSVRIDPSASDAPADTALDLTPPDRATHETMAAHAAVVLAKTQAAAARAEVADLDRRLAQATTALDRERSETARLRAQMSAAERSQAVLERDRAVAEARADELRRQVEQERIERSMLAERIGALEADREEAISAMSRRSRKRYEQRRSRMPKPTTPTWMRNPEVRR